MKTELELSDAYFTRLEGILHRFHAVTVRRAGKIRQTNGLMLLVRACGSGMDETAGCLDTYRRALDVLGHAKPLDGS